MLSMEKFTHSYDSGAEQWQLYRVLKDTKSIVLKHESR